MLTKKIYDVGDVIRLKATFTNDAGEAIDPTTVTLRVKAPSGTVTTVPNTKDAVGVYHGDMAITESDRWYYRWESTGTGAAAEEGSFEVREQAVPSS